MVKSNDKGFTFIELLATITILGILVTATVVTYNHFLAKSHLKYYKSQEDLITLAGKQYFTDYRNLLPKEIGTKESVDLATLYAKKYIDQIKDYKGKTCQAAKDIDSNKVYAYKVGEGNYKYYTIIECNGYKTNMDTKGPVMVFTPKTVISKRDINVVMKITDNKKVDSYSYEIVKNGTVVKQVENSKYTSPITITLTEEGTYVIRGHAIDEWGNKTDKTSKKYVIDKTGPDCSKIRITSTNNSVKQKWQNKDAKLKIAVPNDIAKFNFYNCFKLASNFNSELCRIDGKNLKGTINKTLKGSTNQLFTNDNQKDNGHVFGKITAYDEAGNSCNINTDEYYLDKEAPIIKNIDVVSSNINYKSLIVNIKLSLTDRVDKTDNHIYYSISNDGKNYSNFFEYPINEKETIREWNLGGSYDGKERTIYIKIKDDISNEAEIQKQTYKVYKSCESLVSTKTEGACSGSCGSQSKAITTTYKDQYTGETCRTTNTSESCITDTCQTPSCEIVLSSGPNGSNNWYKSSVNYSLNAYHAASYGINALNGVTGGTINTDGTHTITGYVQNAAGTVNTCSATVKYDGTAPTCTWVSGKTNWTKSYNTWKGCSDSTSGCATSTITSKITTSAKTSTLTAYSISDNAGNTTDCPSHKINAYVDTTAPCVKLVIARDYKGPLCVDHPKTKYEYRYDIAMTDAHSGMKSTSCSGGGFSISRNVKADSILRHQGVREQFCNQKSISKITCSTCDYLDNCKEYTIRAAGKQCP